MPLQGLCWPGVEELVEEFAAVPANVFGLAGNVGSQDGEEASAVRVLDNEPHAHDPRSRHHVGRILDQVDDVLHQSLEKPAMQTTSNGVILYGI